MKKLSLLVLAALPFILNGCLSGQPSMPVKGIVYQNTKAPVQVTDNANNSKVGSAECKSFMFISAWGDCSLDAAKKAGNISKVSYVDAKADSILGIYSTYTVSVYGE